MGITKYFNKLFAVNGDRTAVPDTTPVDNSVNYDGGWTPPYSYDEGVPGALFVQRSRWNQIVYDITQACQQYQQNGVPNFITTADNLGYPYPYSAGALVLYDDGFNGARVFQSLVDSNITLPTDATRWVWIKNSANNINYQNVTFNLSVANGMAVYLNSSGVFFPAISNGAAAQNFVGFANIGLGTVTSFGVFSGLSGLTVGSVYYLSSLVAGGITLTQTNVKIGIAINATTLLVNPSVSVSTTSPFDPMYIVGLYVSPGTILTTQINISAIGACRDLGNTVNMTLASPITNKSVLTTWAAGNGTGCVPSNILVSWLAGAPANATVHGFLISQSNGTTCDFAIDTSLTGVNILSDVVIQAAGYTKIRRVASFVVTAAATIRPIYQVGDFNRLFDNISSFAISPAFTGGVGALVTIQVPDVPRLMADVYLLCNAGGATSGMAYPANQTAPTPSTGYRDTNGGVSSSGIPLVTISRQIGYIQTTNSTCTINAGGWTDNRKTF